MIILMDKSEILTIDLNNNNEANFVNDSISYKVGEEELLLDEHENLKTLNWEIFKSKNTNKIFEIESFTATLQKIHKSFEFYFENVLTKMNKKGNEKLVKNIIKSCKKKISETNNETEKLNHIKSLFSESFWLVDSLYQYYLYDDLCLFPFVVVNFMLVYMFKLVFLMKVINSGKIKESMNINSDNTYITVSKVNYIHTLLNYLFRNESLVKMNIISGKTVEFNFEEFFDILKKLFSYLLDNISILMNYENLNTELQTILDSINSEELTIYNLDNSRKFVNLSLEDYVETVENMFESNVFEQNFTTLYITAGQRKMYNKLFSPSDNFYYGSYFNKQLNSIGDKIDDVITNNSGFLILTPNFKLYKSADIFNREELEYLDINNFNGLSESLIIKFNLAIFYLLELSTNSYTKNIYSVIWKYLIIENNSILNSPIDKLMRIFGLDGNSYEKIKNNCFLLQFIVETFTLALTSTTEKKTPLTINYPTNLIFVEDISTFSQNKNELSVSLSYYKNLFKDIYEQADKIIELLTIIKSNKKNSFIIYLGNLKINLDKMDKGISDAIINFSFNNKYYEPTLNFINEYKIKFNNKTPYMSLLPLTIPLMDNVLYENNKNNLTFKTGCNTIYGKYTNNVEIEFLNNNINTHNNNNINKISIEDNNTTNDIVFKALRFMKNNSVAARVKTEKTIKSVPNDYQKQMIERFDVLLNGIIKG